MDPVYIKLTTFIAAATAVAGLFSIFSDLILREKARIKERLKGQLGGDAARSRRTDVLKDLRSLQSGSRRRLPEIWARLTMMIEQSGLDVEPERVIQIAGTVALVGAVLGLALTQQWSVGLAGAVGGFLVPFVYVYVTRRSRIQTLCMQLPEAFELMSRAVKAGQTMSGAMQTVATQLKAPISVEFAFCCEQLTFGLPQEVALQELARRTGVIELQLFVVAMLVHRSAGGNPIEILSNLSEVIRKRVQLRGKVKAATSEGRLQAVVLMVLPLGAFLALLVLNRPYVQILLDRPRLLLSVLMFQALGTLWIRRIVNFKY